MVYLLYVVLDNFLWVVVMAAWLIAVIGVVYLVVGIDLMTTGKMGLGIAFLGYSFSNVGLYLAART